MTPRIATVLSAREWESALVALSRETAAVRLVLRAYQPEDLERDPEEVDVVVAGAETSWVTPAQIASWRRAGLSVVGVYPAGDGPARDLLETGGADEVLPDDVPASVIIDVVARLRSDPRPRPAEKEGCLIAITGSRGAPGRTEIGLGLAWNLGARRDTLLIDLDLEAPAVAVRLGRPPRPDVTDVADAVRATGELPEQAVQRTGPIALIVGSHRPGEPPLRELLAEDVAEAAAGTFERVVLDLGPATPNDRLLKRSDHAVLVADASATGLVRAARVAAEWAGPPPALVINRVHRGDVPDIVRAARRWTGLEPVALVRDDPRISAASRRARPPERILRKALRSLEFPT